MQKNKVENKWKLHFESNDNSLTVYSQILSFFDVYILRHDCHINHKNTPI